MSLFSFQGKIYLGARDANGKAKKLEWVGNAPSLTLQLQTNNVSKTESYSGNRLQIGNLRGAKTATLSMTLDEWTKTSLALALYATQSSVAGATVTGEAAPTAVVANDILRLDNAFVSDIEVSIGSSNGVLGTDYRIESESGGLIEMLVTPGSGDAVTFDYEHATRDSFAMFGTLPPERFLLLDGINTENNERVNIELFRVQFNPVGDLSLITDEYGNIPLTGTVLYDAKNASADLGGFGRVQQLPEA